PVSASAGCIDFHRPVPNTSSVLPVTVRCYSIVIRPPSGVGMYLLPLVCSTPASAAWPTSTELRGRVRGCPSTLRHVPRGRNQGDARRRTGPQAHHPATARPPAPAAPTARHPTDRRRPGRNGNRDHH